MNKQVEYVEQYLNEVREHLGVLPDRDQIINELRSHIWDLANRLSVEKGLTVQEAFNHAILRMEDPQVLASKFLDEEPVSTISDWRAPRTTPESKVRNEQFILIAFLGIISVVIMTLIIGVTEQLRLSGDSGSALSSTVMLLIPLAFGAAAITMFVVVLYFYDEKLFRKQIDNLRRVFLRPSEEKPTLKTSTKTNTTFTAGTLEKAEPSFWGAFGEHLGGFLGGFFIGLAMIFFFVIDITQLIPLYNQNWYYIGFIALYVSLGADFIESVFKLIFGQIRATRFISIVTNAIAAICSIILILYYPFTIELALKSIFPDATFIVGIPGVFDVDTGVKVIIGIAAIIQFLSALYGAFKFGAWKPSDRKSLI